MTDWTFPGADPVGASISIAAGRVSVTAETTDACTVRLEPSTPGRGEDTLSQYRVEFTDGRLDISGPKHSGLRRSYGADVTVTIPAGSWLTVSTASADVSCLGLYGELDARTASGDVRVTTVAGPAVIRTASGDAWLDEVTGEARLDSASGDLRLERAGADVVASTASGDLRIGVAAGCVTARSASGDVQVGCIQAGETQVTNVSGDVFVGVAPGAGVYLDLSALTGRIGNQLDEAADPGDGAGQLTLKCKTVSGDISVVRAAAVPPA